MMFSPFPILLVQQPIEPLITPSPTPPPIEATIPQAPIPTPSPRAAIAPPEVSPPEMGTSDSLEPTIAEPPSEGSIELEASPSPIGEMPVDPTDAGLAIDPKSPAIPIVVPTPGAVAAISDALESAKEKIPTSPTATEPPQGLEQQFDRVTLETPALDEAVQQQALVGVASAIAQGQFDRARKAAQHPALPKPLQQKFLAEIATQEARRAKTVATEATQQKREAQITRTQAAQKQLDTQAIVSPAPTATATPLRPINLGPVSVGERGIGFNLSTVPLSGQQLKDITGRSLQLSKLLKGNLLFPIAIPAPITSRVGWRVHPVTGSHRFHAGTDIGAPEGTPIVAAYGGKVTGADYMGGYGLSVVIQHNNGMQETLYAHMSEMFVRPGMLVNAGTVIGRVGSTGLSTGPHLHFEFRQLTSEGWVTLDPYNQLEYAQAQLVRAFQAGGQTIAMPVNDSQSSFPMGFSLPVSGLPAPANGLMQSLPPGVVAQGFSAGLSGIDHVPSVVLGKRPQNPMVMAPKPVAQPVMSPRLPAPVVGAATKLPPIPVAQPVQVSKR